MVVSELDKIAGIGNVTKQKLLIEYKSLEKIKKVPQIELEKIIGKTRAKIIYDYFFK